MVRNKLFLFLVLGIVVLSGIFTGRSSMAGSTIQTTTDTSCLDADELHFFDLLNGYRNSQGKLAVVLNATLTNAADYHAHDNDQRGVLDHYVADGRWFITVDQDYGYPYGRWGGEIIGARLDTDTMFQAFQLSPDHNAIMLDGNAQAVGIARVYSTNFPEGPTYVWVADFGGVDDGTRPLTCGQPAPTPTETPTPGPTAVPTATPCHGHGRKACL